MNAILAIETATEACSVALSSGQSVRQRYEVTPRQHNQRVFAMLEELLPGGGLKARGVEAIAYGCGPGSFTGLRIAASAVQGLSFATGLPAIPVSTLAAQVQTALRVGQVASGQWVLSALDARVNEVFYAWFRVDDGEIIALTPARACAPAQVTIPRGAYNGAGIGSGCQFVDIMPGAVQRALATVSAETMPQARDLIPLASRVAAAGGTQTARQVQPLYVRDEINWKKIPEQGKRG